jgi:hypothetical protein
MREALMSRSAKQRQGHGKTVAVTIFWIGATLVFAILAFTMVLFIYYNIGLLR